MTDEAGNYSSGDDYTLEFLGYRFSFAAHDFRERVAAAAVRLGAAGYLTLGFQVLVVPALVLFTVAVPPVLADLRRR